MRTAPLVHALALGALSLTAAAQSPRPSQQVSVPGSSNAGQVGVASADDLTAIVWSDGTAEQVLVSTTDGRGLAFGLPVRVDADTASKTTQTDSVHVAGDAVYVFWEAASGLWFARSTDRGLTYTAPVALDVGGGNLRDWRIALAPDPAGDHLYALCSTAIADEDLFLTASHDGGASFPAAVSVPAVGSLGDVDALGLAAVGTTVHLAWDDNRSGRDTVYYQRSVDGGASFLAADVPLGDNPGVEDSQSPIEVAASGSTVAVLWNEEPTGSGNEALQVNVSTDGGGTFAGPRDPGTYSVAFDDVDFGHVAIASNGNVLATWEDNRTGTDEVHVATSTDGGLSWGGEVQLSAGGAERPRFAGTGLARPTAAVLWESTLFPRAALASESLDGGGSWGPIVPVSDNSPNSVDFVTGAHNELYGNFIGAWTALVFADAHVYSGGFRPQTLGTSNLTSGQSSSFLLSDFRGAEPLVWVLLSGATGSLPAGFGDGRDLGLSPFDPLFGLSLSYPGLFLTTLDPLGSGATAPAPILLPPGTAFHGVGVSFTTVGGVLLGELTDAELLVVQ